jgi:L-methionine (R)-S-oxide reductase
VSSLAEALQAIARDLAPGRDALLHAWVEALAGRVPWTRDETRRHCEGAIDELLGRLAAGDLDGFLEDEASAAAEAARRGDPLAPLALSIRVLDRCLRPFLLSLRSDREALADTLLALDELADRRLEILLGALEEESSRRLVEAQEQAARAQERARALVHVNKALRESQARSQHRADQVSLLASMARRIVGVLEPERLLQEAAEVLQSGTGHRYVAVVVLDHEGVLVGRWAGRPGVGRRSAGRAQGPAAGIIGRALRKRAPQLVPDVGADPDYHADVPGTVSELVVPLLEDGQPVGAIDLQSDRRGSFELDDVVAGEALAEFVVVALRNARRLQESRRP